MFSFLFRKRRQTSPWRPERPQTMTIEGRRHRIDTPYLLPQDGQEINRLDFQHYALRAALGGDYLSPLEATTLRTLLDVGCGTGRWARERAEEFPQAVVTGLDIEAHLPEIALPTNFRFVQANILAGFPFPDASFDFVHQRLLVGAIPARQWPQVVHELVRVTRSQGWVEVLESGAVYHQAGPATKQFQAWWRAGDLGPLLEGWKREIWYTKSRRAVWANLNQPTHENSSDKQFLCSRRVGKPKHR